ncbi:PilZ domain-containing protein [Mangrovitalea sediminis]|uniref:PilZ domain-containing protein n=1 Tax=Mangrovitalea sediminis TaxID=1982043 RepID=UPI00130476CE|nr:PilZ domain-containing protein [Mangrovitalea sediminis]
MHSAQNAQAHERRRFRRFPAAELSVQVKTRRGLFGKWETVNPEDFTRTGLAFESTGMELEKGDVVEVRATLLLDMGDLKVDRLVAVVRNLHRHGIARRYGLEFDYSASRHMKALTTQAQLGRIEGILDRSEKLRRRLHVQQDEQEAR